ncbi:trehalase family glycosidase [Legionella jamestowniensis]|uniref:Alpha,alpha-trehalase n=1 Tax=Legionella jamestowniensis TaxID=455 RepID=A0A0W0UNQ2_9GAMM|nr:trehalase family glycosidase [Legionella jamestowniensis]KTD09367.1 Alpha,alpha-trehalase [Legionella jamestowniensis]SFL88209.1 alpha,alpha-trehalase [Legionella jamestowniensis DSM 19215]
MHKLFIICFVLFVSFSTTANNFKINAENSDVTRYIEKSWDILTRDNYNLLKSQHDTKLTAQHLIIYIPKEEDINAIRNKAIKKYSQNKNSLVEFRYLPKNTKTLNEHGLLYLPHPYVVPGGRFNEMYGWDSYFIELGLLEHNRLKLARNMVDNALYEIKHYGTILNANRSYYLNRSHPPLLTEMILAYYRRTGDKEWLATTIPAIDKLYQYWMSPPHLISELGLSRYYAMGQGPCPEESSSYYEKVIEYFRTHSVADYDKSMYFDKKANQLTALFYKADRTVRESGLDITEKYGPFSAGILDYAPVDLNTLLYKMEEEAGEINRILNNYSAAKVWEQRAVKRAELINHYLWDESTGYYFDYNFKSKKLRPYIYASTFYPLWAGVASKQQAAAIVKNLPHLLAKGGLLTSTHHPGLQWDAPFGWAPLQYFAVYGLKRYGYTELALDIAQRFIKTVNKGFQENHTIFEKYDVETLGVKTKDKIKFSYASNEMGFGWTNGVYLVFLKLINQNQTINR